MPPVTVLEEGAGDEGPTRLQCEGCSLEPGWIDMIDEQDAVVGACLACEMTLCGEAGTVTIFVPEAPLPDGAGVLPALRQPLQILPGAHDVGLQRGMWPVMDLCTLTPAQNPHSTLARLLAQSRLLALLTSGG